MTPALEVIEAGPSSTLQDSGRFGYLASGVSPSGPCDRLLHAIANRLADNSPETAAIEFSLRGDRYRCRSPSCRIAVAGDFPVQIDGEPVRAFRSHVLREGQILSVGYGSRDLRGYLAVGGGFSLPPVLGSLSVHVRSGIGPMGGRAIASGDHLPLSLGEAPAEPDIEFDTATLPARTGVIRVVRGPQDSYFDEADLQSLMSANLTVTPQCDRMGYQLNGPQVDYRKDWPLISEGIPLGAVQVPGDGLFIIAMVDRQTVGGYPKAATVIGPDIRILAQAGPGAVLQMQDIGIAEAQTIGRERAAFIRNLDVNFRSIVGRHPTTEELMAANLISGVHFAD